MYKGKLIQPWVSQEENPHVYISEIPVMGKTGFLVKFTNEGLVILVL